MPRNEGPDSGLMPIGEDLDIDAGKLDSFDNLTATLEAILVGVVKGKATRFQIQAAMAVVENARETLVAKAQHQERLEALRTQGMVPVIGADGRIIGARREGEEGIPMPTVLQGGRTGTPYRKNAG